MRASGPTMATDDGPAADVTAWTVGFGGLVVFLLLVALERAFAMVFVLNFSTAGLTPSILFILMLLSAFLYPLGLARLWPHPVRALDGVVVLFAQCVLWSLFPAPFWAALLSLLGWLVATPLVFALVGALRGRFAEAIALGLLVHLAGRVWLDTLPFAASGGGFVWVTAAAVAAFAVWALVVRGALVAPAVPRVHAVTPVLFLAYAFLASPAVIASWTGTGVLPVAGATVFGLLTGIFSLRIPAAGRTVAVVLSAVVLSVSLVLLLFAAALPLLATLLANAALVHLAFADLQRHARSLAGSALRAGLVQVAVLAAVFLHATAPSWAFVPVAPLVHGRAPMWAFALGAIVALGALGAVALRNVRAAQMRLPPLPERFIGASLLGLVLVTAGGFILHEGVADPAPDGDPVRIATYNIHQYFSTEQTGHYNLEAVAQVIEESGAEVVGLQETEGARITSGALDGVRWLGHRLDMHVAYGPPARAQVYGIAVLSKYPILDSEWVSLPARESVERVAMQARLDTPYGPVPFVVTHFQTESFAADRHDQARALVAWTDASERAWVVGDFNTPPDPEDPAYNVLTFAYRDAWTASGHGSDGGATTLDETPGKRIDHVYLMGAWDVTACARHGDGRASDHRLVACDVRPPGWVPVTT